MCAWLSAEAGPDIEFTVAVTPRRYEIFFMDFYGDDMEFQSQQQCNTYGGPPIDTVPLGDTVRWVNKRYYETFQVLSVGEPSFPSSGAIKLDDSYSLVFTTPGTYRYVEAGDPTIGGTIVVR